MAEQLQKLVDQLAECLPKWKAAMMPKSGRLLQIQSMLYSMLINAMMALDIQPKTLTTINKILIGFIWCGKVEANGGSCVVAWDLVCTSTWAGGLGIPNLGCLNIAMHAQWPWLPRSDGERPWAEFDIPVPKESITLLNAALRATIGDRHNTML